MSSWSIAAALLALAPGLHAQEATPSVLAAPHTERDPQGAVRVTVTTPETDLLLTVAGRDEKEAIVSCYNRCSFWGFPGTYSLWATSPERGIKYKTTLYVGPDTAFKVSTGHDGARTAGLVIGLVSPVVAAAGLLLAVQGLEQTECEDCAGKGTTETRAGLLMLLGGLVGTPVGWDVFATSEQTWVEPVDEQASSQSAPHVEVGLLPLPRGGLGLGLSGAF